MASRPIVYGALACGVLIVSCAAILIRIAQAEGMSSAGIAACRLGIAIAVLLPITFRHVARDLGALHRRDLFWVCAAGACLAIHFATWIASLEYTSVASSTALVTTNPVWVGLASVVLLRERLSQPVIIGIVLAAIGTLAMIVTESGTQGLTHGNPLLGNSLALIGAISASAYLIIGRSQRARTSLLGYITVVYGVAALLLLAFVLVRGESLLGFSPLAYACVAALAIGPQLIGHTILNWSVRHVSATLVALSILGEPVGSSLLALVVFDESIGWLQGVAFALILAGIFFAAKETPVAR